MDRGDRLKFVRFNSLGASERGLLAASGYDVLRSLNGEYPRFSEWYKGLFTSNATLDANREMVFCLCGNKVAGVAILKYSEKKVCTLRVCKGYRGRSIGTRLLMGSFDLLETDRPLITVRSTRLGEYARLFKRFGFRMEDRKFAYYSLAHSECAFNGVLDKRVPVVNTVEFLRMQASMGVLGSCERSGRIADDTRTIALFHDRYPALAACPSC